MELDEVLQGYVVCSSPCGGSEVLGRLLRKTKQVGFPHYFFHHNVHTESLHKKWSVIDNNGDINYVRYFQRLQEKRTTKNGVFGLLTYTKQLIEHHRLMSTLPNSTIINCTAGDTPEIIWRDRYQPSKNPGAITDKRYKRVPQTRTITPNRPITISGCTTSLHWILCNSKTAPVSLWYNIAQNKGSVDEISSFRTNFGRLPK